MFGIMTYYEVHRMVCYFGRGASWRCRDVSRLVEPEHFQPNKEAARICPPTKRLGIVAHLPLAGRRLAHSADV
jgi:hypothetical protein